MKNIRDFGASADRTLDTALPRPGLKPLQTVTTFDRYMLGVAEAGSYLDILVVMLAAEWMYATWCGRAYRRLISDPDISDWVRLHAECDFLAQAEWLMAGVDADGVDIDAATFAHLSDLFGTALRLEINFHTAAYEVTPT